MVNYFMKGLTVSESVVSELKNSVMVEERNELDRNSVGPLVYTFRGKNLFREFFISLSNNDIFKLSFFISVGKSSELPVCDDYVNSWLSMGNFR